jgi:HK97 family phage portal protein
MSYWRAFARWLAGGLLRRAGLQYGGPSGREADDATEKPVTFDSAMQLSVVWACVKLLSETVASLPLNVYRKRGGQRVPASEHPLSLLFAGRVNRYQNRIEFFESVILNLVLHGNAYVLIDRRGGMITSLLPLMSAQMEVTLLLDGSVVYTYTQDTGVDVIAPERIWHIKGMGNGIIGLSAMDYQRRSLGIAVGAEKATAKTYANGGKRSGVLMIDRVLTPEQRAMVRQNFNGLVEGGERLFVLEAGAKFEPVAMSPQDIELLSSRKFNVEDLARWYGVPSVMINDTGGSTVWGSGISEIVRGFYKLTLRPILEKLELSMIVTLLPVSERSEIEFEFDFEGLLRSDQKSRFDGYRVGIQGAITTPNECRAWEGLPPMEGGDVLYMQGATVPITMTGQQTQPAPVPETQPQEPQNGT